MRLNRLEWRLPAAIAVLLLLVSGTLAAMTYAESRRAAVTSARSRLQHLARLLTTTLEGSATMVRQQSLGLAANPAVVSVLKGVGDAGALRAMILPTLQPGAQTYRVELWRTNGTSAFEITSKNPVEMDSSWPGYPVWASPDGVTVSSIVPARQGGAYGVAAPVLEDGRLLGYVVSRRRVGTTRESGRLVADLMGVGSRVLIGQPDNVWVDLFGQPSGSPGVLTLDQTGGYWAVDGRTRWLGVGSDVKGTSWRIRVEFPERIVFADSMEVLRNTIFIALMVTALGAVGGWIISRRLIGPLQALTTATATVAQGGDPMRVPSTSDDEIGELAAAFNIMAERVTEGRHHLEARVTERTEELATALSRLEDDAKQLARSNRELEAFSYTISHDLRAPLRSIDGFSDVLLTDFSHQLDDTGKSHLRRVRRATQRMGQLIDDLLELSRVSRVELVARPVALDPIASRLVRDLRERDPDREVDVVIQPGPPANGDARLLALVMQNLFENAWKFTAKRGGPARIEFGVSQSGPPATYFVKDNGVGFDMAHAGKLFGIFQRLHSMDEFPGTGVGLAIVHRVVERHGGRIWVDAKPDEGATFFFTLEGGRA